MDWQNAQISNMSPIGSTSTTMNMMTEEEFEPYVRRKRAEGANRKKMQGLNEQEQNLLRNSINSRERRRMHELNEEFESLRECLPYSNDANSRRMSKANTLLLATNWIKTLQNSNHLLQAKVDAVTAQLTAALTKLAIIEPKSQSSTPPAISPKCAKCQQNACFSVSCITSS